MYITLFKSYHIFIVWQAFCSIFFDGTKQELTQFDVVVNATSTFTPDTYHLQTDLSLLLVKALANTNTRLIVVGGAGTLYSRFKAIKEPLWRFLL